MNETPSIVWFRTDLRLSDHPALHAASERGGGILPLFILPCEAEEREAAPGGAARWWLHHSLASLSSDLQARGSRLVLREGRALAVLLTLVQEVGAGAVYWNRRYEPRIVERDGGIKAALREVGLEVRSFGSTVLREPWEVATKQGDPYRVFTPYWRASLALGDPGAPLPVPRKWASPGEWPESRSLESFRLEPRHGWARRFPELWRPGQSGARERLDGFVSHGLSGYSELRDVPGAPGTSRLSPHLHFGEMGPREVWHAVREAAGAGATGKSGTDWRAHPFLTELGWREFAHHLLYHFPDTVTSPLRPEFEDFPWIEDAGALAAWQQGRTGYPLVDAGMRQLWAVGWMHNRVRMIVASFLVKHLLQPWQEGARWFMDTLVDADLASNTLGWQWSAGCGADAAPYFRVFNPVRQGERFDPEGHYIREWIPELARLDRRWIHAPWGAPEAVLRGAGVTLGEDYPHPIVDHPAARARALAAWARMRTAG